MEGAARCPRRLLWASGGQVRSGTRRGGPDALPLSGTGGGTTQTRKSPARRIGTPMPGSQPIGKRPVSRFPIPGRSEIGNSLPVSRPFVHLNRRGLGIGGTGPGIGGFRVWYHRAASCVSSGLVSG